MEVFSKRLIDMRKEFNMTQTDLAIVLMKKRSTISGYETGGKEPDYSTLLRIAKHFEVTIDYLLGATDNKIPPIKIVQQIIPDETVKALKACQGQMLQALNEIQLILPN